MYYKRINISEGIDPGNSNNSKECMICHYWSFNHEFKFLHSVCNGCHDLRMFSVNISHVTIITLKSIDYHRIIHDVSKSEAIYLLENYVLDDRGHI